MAATPTWTTDNPSATGTTSAKNAAAAPTPGAAEQTNRENNRTTPTIDVIRRVFLTDAWSTTEVTFGSGEAGMGLHD